MNVTATIPATWKPNDTKAINEWFDKIHNHVQKQKIQTK